MSKKALILFFLGAIALSFVLYGNTIGGEFVYDDYFFTRRTELKEPQALLQVWRESYLPNNQDVTTAYRPLPIFTFSLNYVLFGDSTASFHAFNIVLNGIVIFLLFLVVWELFKNKILAIFTTLFYAFLPIHTEAVAFIKARDDILATLFSLISWYIFLKATSKEKINIWLVLLASVFWLLAVMGKEIAIVMPAVFLLVFWIQNKVDFYRVFKTSLFFIPAILAYFSVRFMILGEQFLARDQVYFIFDPLREADFLTRVWTAFKIAFIYIGKTFVPVNLSTTYSYNHLKLVSNPFSSIEALVGLLLLAVLVYLIVNKRTRSTFGIGALIFLIPYLMLSKFFVQLSEIASEKWMYLPSIGLSLIAGFVFYHLFEYKKWLGVSSLIMVLAIYVPILIQRNTIWASKESLAKSMVRDAPNSAFSHFQLAAVYYEQDKFKEAKAEIAESLKINQDYAPVMNLVALLALQEGREDIANQAIRKAIGLRSDELQALVLIKEGKYQETLDLISTFDPRVQKKSTVVFLFAVSYYKLGMKEEARKYFDWDPSKSEAEKIKILEEF